MKPDAQGWCDSYYGTWNIKEKPRLGVHYFMIDEHIKKSIEKEKDLFNKDMSKIIDNFNKHTKALLKKSSEEVKVLSTIMNDMTKFIYKLIDLNKLKEPSIEKKIKSKKKVENIKVNEKESSEEIDYGYL